MNTHFSKKWLLLFIALALMAFGLTHCSQKNSADQAPPAKNEQIAPTMAVPSNSQAMADFRTAITRVARNTIPAVVHIEVTQQQSISNPMQPFENNPFFHFFFNMPQNVPRKFKRELKGLGSGMIMDTDGHILTNNHVVAGANQIKVLLDDGREFSAKLVGTDPKTDLAVIQIDADGNLPHVTFGDSDKLNVGDWVVAIGHPRGLDQTVTQGIISAKHRRGILNPSGYQDYLQTDAAINPGNSGGPLLNLAGEVIGVNSAIESESGGFEGIGFAIPSKMAVHVARQLISHGRVERGWLGVSIETLKPSIAKSMDLKITKGALIKDVVKDSPADKAGLRKGDVVTHYDGHAITDASDLQNLVADTARGTTKTMTLIRDGKNMDVEVQIGSLDDAIKQMAASVEDKLGATVRPMTTEEAQKYGIQEGSGVAIAHLEKNSPLAQAGFEVDDIITAINNIPVRGVQSFADIIKSLPANQSVVLTAVDHRTGQTGYVQLLTR